MTFSRKEQKIITKAMKAMRKIQADGNATSNQKEHAYKAYSEMWQVLSSTPEGRDLLDWYDE